MSDTVVINVPVRAEELPLSETAVAKIKKKILNAALIQWGRDAEVELFGQYRRIPGFNPNVAQIAEFTMWKVEGS